jgi:hypothetical protein
MALKKAIEAGNAGLLISLGGIIGRIGAGREIASDYLTSVGGNYVQVLDSNPKRLSAIVQNRGTDLLLVAFGEMSVSGSAILIDPHGSFQIDQNFPWTGPVFVTSPTNVDFSIFEVSVP